VTAPAPCAKRRYRTKLDAKIALAGTAREAARRGAGTRRSEQRAYWCPACRGFHLTSEPRARP
jgi:hypothetical protein